MKQSCQQYSNSRLRFLFCLSHKSNHHHWNSLSSHLHLMSVSILWNQHHSWHYKPLHFCLKGKHNRCHWRLSMILLHSWAAYLSVHYQVCQGLYIHKFSWSLPDCKDSLGWISRSFLDPYLLMSKQHPLRLHSNFLKVELNLSIVWDLDPGQRILLFVIFRVHSLQLLGFDLIAIILIYDVRWIWAYLTCQLSID